MRAAVWGWMGGPSIDAGRKVPTCGRGEVLIKVMAAGINPVDYKMGRFLGQVVGMDMAGVVESIGQGVTSLQVGDEVFGIVSGSLTEYVVAKTATLGKKAHSQSFTDAAAIPIAYLTSLQSLRDAGSLRPGGRVLIIGASGGCGTSGIQLSKALGASHIEAVCSGKNAALVQELGADKVIDYTQEDLMEHFKELKEEEKFDVVYDTASGSGGGEDYKEKSLKLLSKEGQYVAINGAASFWVRQFTIGQKKNQKLVIVDPNTKDLEDLAGMVTESGFRPVIAKQLPLTEDAVKEGFKLLKSRRAVGKVVFDMTM